MARDETRDLWTNQHDLLHGPNVRVMKTHPLRDDDAMRMRGYILLVPHDQLEAVERERDASREAQNELGDVLRTTCCSWTAIINSARELVALWEASKGRIAELERDWELERSRWHPLQQWSQSETDAGRAELGESCFATALKRIRTQEKRIAELEATLK